MTSCVASISMEHSTVATSATGPSSVRDMAHTPERVRAYLLDLQARIVAALEAEDGAPFRRDHWQREPGGKLEGEGRSQLLEDSAMIERGGCNFSHVKGSTLPPSATQHRPELAGAP